MSSRQKPRTPVHFPKMKHRARKRKHAEWVTVDTRWKDLSGAIIRSTEAVEEFYVLIVKAFDPISLRRRR